MSLIMLLRLALVTMSHEIINTFMKFTNKILINGNEKMQHADFLNFNLIDLCWPFFIYCVAIPYALYA